MNIKQCDICDIQAIPSPGNSSADTMPEYGYYQDGKKLGRGYEDCCRLQIGSKVWCVCPTCAAGIEKQICAFTKPIGLERRAARLKQ